MTYDLVEKKHFMGLSLRMQAMIVFAIVAIVPTVVFMVAVRYLEERDERAHVEELLQSVAVLRSKSVEGEYASRYLARIQDWASDGYIRESAARSSSNVVIEPASSELAGYLRKYKLSLEPNMVAVDVYDVGGRLITASNALDFKAEHEGLALLVRKALHAKQGDAILGAIVNEGETKSAFHVASPLYVDNATSAVGVLVGRVSGEVFAKMFSDSTKSRPQIAGHDSYVISITGSILTASSPRLLQMKRPLLIKPAAVCFGEGRDFSGEYTDVEGKKVFGVGVCLLGAGKVVVSQVPISKIDIGAHIIILFSLVVVFAELLAYIIAGRFTKGINEVSQVVKSVEAGDYSKRIVVDGVDEFSRLCLRINAMVENLSRAESEETSVQALKDKFIQVVSHQMRTPLGSVGWNLEMLEDGDFGELSPEQKEVVSQARTANTSILARIDQLATAMELNFDDRERVCGSVDIDAVWNSLQDKYRERARAEEKIYESFTSALAGLWINGSEKKIILILCSLIDNAFDYTKSGKRISALFERRGSVLRFEVNDTGIGIPLRFQPDVFKLFYRTPEAIKLKADSSGLSLAIVKTWVVQCGGSIGFTSTEGEGASFWIDFIITENESKNEEHSA